MPNLSFAALVRFPGEAYFEFNSAMNGIAIVDSIAKEENDYHANITFDIQDIPGCISAITSLSGTIVEMFPEKIKATSAVGKYAKKRTYKPRGKNTKMGALRDLLKNWHTVSELVTMTNSPPSSIHSRFTKLKHHKLLQSKMGPQGKPIYRLKATAAAAA